MGGRARTEIGLIEGFPLATGPKHIKDGIGTFAIWHTRSPAAKAMGVHMDR
jgi:hypothetical protein